MDENGPPSPSFLLSRPRAFRGGSPSPAVRFRPDSPILNLVVGSNQRSSAENSPLVSPTNTKVTWQKDLVTTRSDSESTNEDMGDWVSTDAVKVWSGELINLWLEDSLESFLAFEVLLQLLELSLNAGQNNYPHFADMGDWASTDAVKVWSGELINLWLEDSLESFLAFEVLLQLLELSLNAGQNNYPHFAALLDTLPADKRLHFLQEGLPYLIDSDLLFHSDYVDILLLYLTVYQIKTREDILATFIRETPLFGGFYLRQHGKKLQELFEFIHSNEIRSYNPKTKVLSVQIHPHYLACMHVPSKKVIVSNAPPIKLKRRRLRAQHKFSCEMSAGGLVSGIKPSLEKEDVWVSYLDTKVLDLDRMPKHLVPRMIREGVNVPPKIRRSTSILRYSFSETPDDYSDFLYEKAENDFLSLQKRLERFAAHNFVVNPLIILKEDHEGFYNGISNGLFWPAFHNLPDYIIREYRGEEGAPQLSEDWMKYIKVNFHFAIHAARSCRKQDFLWIHDYHLFLVGAILRSLDPTLDHGFFLHIPFRLSDQFMAEFPEQGLAVLNGLLGFTRVGFQSNRDTLNFIRLVRANFRSARIENRGPTESLVFTVRRTKPGGVSVVTDVGTFPISIKTERIREMAAHLDAQQDFLDETRSDIMGDRDGKLFLSVERFDYTKGLLERMDAIECYFSQHPERASKDLFYQIAAASRQDVSSYKMYQDMVLSRVTEINNQFSINASMPVIYVDQSNQPQEEVVQLYKVSDVVVVTPVADGMNLVIKEAILANRKAVLVLSTGSGAENQLFDAGLGDCYLRVVDIKDKNDFAEALYRAISLPSDVILASAQKLYTYTLQRDIDYWIESFTNPSWTHKVIPPVPVNCCSDFQGLLVRLDSLQKEIAVNAHNSVHTSRRVQDSLNNVLETLESVIEEDKPMTVSVCKETVYSINVELIRSLQRDIKRDLMLLNCRWEKCDCNEFFQFFERFSEIDSVEFQTQCGTLHKLYKDIGMADLLVFDVDTWMFQGGENSPFERLQSITDGMLLPRFFCRFAKVVVVVSHQLPLDFLKEKLNFLAEFGVAVCTSDGYQIGDKTVYLNNRSADLESFKQVLQQELKSEEFAGLQFLPPGLLQFNDKVVIPKPADSKTATSRVRIWLTNMLAPYPVLNLGEHSHSYVVTSYEQEVRKSIKGSFEKVLSLIASICGKLVVIFEPGKSHDFSIHKWLESKQAKVYGVQLNRDSVANAKTLALSSVDVMYAEAILQILKPVNTGY